MADGDNITTDYQFQIHDSIAFGAGSGSMSLEAPGVEGLGVPDTKTQDVEWFGRDGVKPNPDYAQLRVVTIHARIKESTAALAMTALDALNAAWQPLTESTELAFQLPGFGLFKVNGRPRGVKADFQLLNRGVIRLLIRFDAVDPTLIPLP